MFKVSKLCKTYIIWVLHFFGDSYTITIVYMINHILAQTSYYSTYHKNVTKTNHDPNLMPFLFINSQALALREFQFQLFLPNVPPKITKT